MRIILGLIFTLSDDEEGFVGMLELFRTSIKISGTETIKQKILQLTLQ